MWARAAGRHNGISDSTCASPTSACTLMCRQLRPDQSTPSHSKSSGPLQHHRLPVHWKFAIATPSIHAAVQSRQSTVCALCDSPSQVAVPVSSTDLWKALKFVLFDDTFSMTPATKINSMLAAVVYECLAGEDKASCTSNNSAGRMITGRRQSKLH